MRRISRRSRRATYRSVTAALRAMWVRAGPAPGPCTRRAGRPAIAAADVSCRSRTLAHRPGSRCHVFDLAHLDLACLDGEERLAGAGAGGAVAGRGGKESAEVAGDARLEVQHLVDGV